jgi:hypothetical protein
MASLARRSKRPRRSRDGFRQIGVVLSLAATLAATLFVVGGYIVPMQHGPATIKAFFKSAATNTTTNAKGSDEEIYTGSILYLPYEGRNCRQLLFDNRTGRFSDNGYVDCVKATYQSGIGSPKQWSAARVKVISGGFKDY